MAGSARRPPVLSQSSISCEGVHIVKVLCNTVESHLDILPDKGANRGMSSKQESPSTKHAARRARTKPVWAEGLRRMYDEVVDEQLPDDFVDLLKKLDQPSDRS